MGKEKYKIKKLSTTPSAKDLEKMGESLGDPTKEGTKPEEAGLGKKRNFGSSSGSAVWKRKISISRKKAVSKYFGGK